MSEFENNNLNLENEPKNSKEKIMYVPDKEVLNMGKKIKKETKKAEKSEKIKPEKLKKEKAPKEPKNKISFKEILNKVVFFFKNIIPKKTDDKKTLIIKIIAIVAAVAILASVIYLIAYFSDLKAQDAAIDDIRNIYELNRDDYSYNEDGQFSKFDVLKAQNSDIIGWVNIPGTQLDNPVYQTVDNDYYITHDMNHENNSYGSLFLDYRCKIDPKALTQNQIIYGHNMRYGAMFGELDKYRDGIKGNLAYYSEHPIISFDSLYESRKYKIFAIMIVDTTTDSTFGYDFSAYRSNFTTQTDFMYWVEYCKQRSLIDTYVDVKPYDEVITLSTCCYDYDDARLVLVGRLIREGEDPEVETDLAELNSDVIFSGKFYKRKGWSVPKVEPPVVSIYD